MAALSLCPINEAARAAFSAAANLRDGGFSVQVMDRGVEAPQPPTRPALLLVMDDPSQGAGHGPTGFQARQLRLWFFRIGRGVLGIFAAGRQPDAAAALTLAAGATQRGGILVFCQPCWFQGWLDYAETWAPQAVVYAAGPPPEDSAPGAAESVVLRHRLHMQRRRA